jgi:hypothetical protein
MSMHVTSSPTMDVKIGLPSLNHLRATTKYNLSLLLNDSNETSSTAASSSSLGCSRGFLPEGGGSESDSCTNVSQSGESDTSTSSSSSKGGTKAHEKDMTAKSEAMTKEQLRKERKREAVRRCRKRKREAALKLEAQFKFQRRRQEVLMNELSKSVKHESDVGNDVMFESGATEISTTTPMSEVGKAMHEQEHSKYPMLHTALREQLLSAQLASFAQQCQQDPDIHFATSFLGMPLPLQNHCPHGSMSSGSVVSYTQDPMMSQKLDELPPRSPGDLQSPSAAASIQSNHHLARMMCKKLGPHLSESHPQGIILPLEKTQSIPSLETPLRSPQTMLLSHNPLASLLAVAEQQLQFISPHEQPVQFIQKETTVRKKKESSNPPKLTEEETKEAKRRERKREAVRRCRLRKRQEHERLQQETQKLLQQNEQLQQTLMSNPVKNTKL